MIRVVLRGSYHNVVPLRAAPKAAQPEGDVQESVLDAARKRYGKPFAHEQGSRFVWSSGPTVLTRWLAERTLRRAA